MIVKSFLKHLMYDLTIMKVSQSAVLSTSLLLQAQQIGSALARLRTARGVKQADAALRAGISRNTAYRLERGDPGLAISKDIPITNLIRDLK
jgi:DNA-binding XRE family transcriptional regulator